MDMKNLIKRTKKLVVKGYCFTREKWKLLITSYKTPCDSKLFDFYKKIEIYPSRYNHIENQYYDGNINCDRGKFNWFAFLFPSFWLLRTKNSHILFGLVVFSLVTFGSLAALFTTYNEALAALNASIFGFIVMINLSRFFLAFYGNSIENINLIKKIAPIVSFVEKTGGYGNIKIEEIIERNGWLTIIFLYISVFIPFILFALLIKAGI